MPFPYVCKEIRPGLFYTTCELDSLPFDYHGSDGFVCKVYPTAYAYTTEPMTDEAWAKISAPLGLKGLS